MYLNKTSSMYIIIFLINPPACISSRNRKYHNKDTARANIVKDNIDRWCSRARETRALALFDKIFHRSASRRPFNWIAPTIWRQPSPLGRRKELDGLTIIRPRLIDFNFNLALRRENTSHTRARTHIRAPRARFSLFSHSREESHGLGPLADFSSSRTHGRLTSESRDASHRAKSWLENHPIKARLVRAAARLKISPPANYGSVMRSRRRLKGRKPAALLLTMIIGLVTFPAQPVRRQFSD